MTAVNVLSEMIASDISKLEWMRDNNDLSKQWVIKVGEFYTVSRTPDGVELDTSCLFDSMRFDEAKAIVEKTKFKNSQGELVIPELIKAGDYIDQRLKELHITAEVF